MDDQPISSYQFATYHVMEGVLPSSPPLPSSDNEPSSELPQTASSVLDSEATPVRNVPGSASSPTQRGTLTITAGSEPMAQRVWIIRTALLRRHCASLRTVCTDSTTASLALPTTAPSTSQNLVDYLHSSIYSPHKYAADYHHIMTHAQAWVLGSALDIGGFCNAALRSLHKELEPLARGPRVMSGAINSPILPRVIEYACENSEVGSVLRTVIFDGVAAHWSQADSFIIGCNASDPSRESSSRSAGIVYWTHVYRTYPDFHHRIANSMKVKDGMRGQLLRPVEDYLQGSLGMKEEEWIQGVGGESEMMMQMPSLLVMRTPEPTAGGRRGRGRGRGRGTGNASSDDVVVPESPERPAVGEEDYMMADDA